MRAAAMLPSCGHVFALLSLEVYEITINICWKKLPDAKTVEKKKRKRKSNKNNNPWKWATLACLHSSQQRLLSNTFWLKWLTDIWTPHFSCGIWVCCWQEATNTSTNPDKLWSRVSHPLWTSIKQRYATMWACEQENVQTPASLLKGRVSGVGVQSVWSKAITGVFDSYCWPVQTWLMQAKFAYWHLPAVPVTCSPALSVPSLCCP